MLAALFKCLSSTKMNLFGRRSCCGLLVIVLRLNLAFGSGWCGDKSDGGGDDTTRQFCRKKVNWRDFDWEAYVEKDWKEEVDAEDPTLRFGVNLKRSIEVGAVREVPDNR